MRREFTTAEVTAIWLWSDAVARSYRCGVRNYCFTDAELAAKALVWGLPCNATTGGHG